MDNQEQPKKKRGFGSMDPQRQREIASLGGIAAHRNGKAHEFNSEEGKAAVRKKLAAKGIQVTKP